RLRHSSHPVRLSPLGSTPFPYTTLFRSFGVPSVISVFITRNYLLPLLPDQIMSIGNFLVTKNILLMLLFAILMIMASWSMIAKRSEEHTSELQSRENIVCRLLLEKKTEQ